MQEVTKWLHCSTRTAFSSIKLVRKRVTCVTCAAEELGVQVKASQCQSPVVLPQSLCLWCAAAACWEGGFRHPNAAAFPPRTALPGLCHPSACTPSGQHPQLLDGGSCWEGAASWWFQLSCPGPRAADRTQCLAHSHETPLITCLEVTSHGFCADLARVEGCVVWQRFPEWAQAKRIWERRSSGLGNGGAKKS